MDVKKFKFFFLWEISRRLISSDLGGPPLRRIKGVLVTSVAYFLISQRHLIQLTMIFCSLNYTLVESVEVHLNGLKAT